MSNLYDRRCEVLVGPPPADNFVLQTPNVLRVSDLHMTFKIERDSKPEPNTLELQIDNLNKQSRALLEGKGFRIVLNAGYADECPELFSGDVRQVVSKHNGLEWQTRILAGDGERAFNYARISQSFPSGSTAPQLIGALLKKLQQDPGNALQKAQQVLSGQQLAGGYVAHGRASTELTNALEPYGWTWSVQNGRIELFGPGDTVEEMGPLISRDTGMIGEPEITEPDKKDGKSKIKVKSLLRNLRPKQRFQLKSDTKSGTFVVEKIVQTGDTAGGDWYSDIEAEVHS